MKIIKIAILFNFSFIQSSLNASIFKTTQDREKIRTDLKSTLKFVPDRCIFFNLLKMSNFSNI